MPSNHFILCHSLLLLPSIFSSIRIFSNESSLCIRWTNYWSFSFSISPSNEYSGLISFRMDWLDLLAVQGTLMSLLQHCYFKASILQHSAYGPTLTSVHDYWKKTIAFTIRTFVDKVISLLFKMLSRFLISLKEQASFNFMPAVTIRSDMGAQENKVCHISTFSPFVCYEVMGLDAMILQLLKQ